MFKHPRLFARNQRIVLVILLKQFLCKISLLRVTYGSYCITNTKINVLWSQVVDRKTKSYTSKPNCDENSLRYLNKNKKMSKQESDVRLSVESPTVRTEMSERQISLGVKEEGTLLVIEICLGTACLVLQWTPAVRVDSPLLTDRVVNLTMI